MADGQASLEGRKIRRYEGKLFTLTSLSSNPTTLLSSIIGWIASLTLAMTQCI